MNDALKFGRTPKHLFHVFPTFDIGGAQVRFAQIVNHFDDTYHHTLFAMDGRYGALERINSSVQLQTLKFDAPKEAGLLQTCGAFKKQLAQLRPDRLLTYNWGSIEWALANLTLGIPHLHTEDGFGPEEAVKQLRRRVWTRKIALSLKTRVVVPSKTLEQVALQEWGLPQARCFYVPNGIDCQRFVGQDGAQARTRFNIPSDKIVIGTIAAIRKEKNLERLLEAFALIDSDLGVHLVIVGDGPALMDLKNFASQLGISNNVTFTGFIDAPHAIVPGFDVFALSSDTEQMPLSVIEAMASGLPIASVCAGDVAEMVATANRPFVCEKEVPALFKSIAEFVKNPNLRADVGQLNQAKAQAEFDEGLMLKRYQTLYNQGHP